MREPDTRNNVKNCLVMAFGAKGVGDHVSCSAFLRNLALNRPGCAIDFGVYSPIGAELFKYNPHIRNIHLLDMDNVKAGGKYALREKIRYLTSFQKLRYDKVYILGSKFRHALFAFLIRGKERIGYDNYHRGFLLTKTGAEPRDKNIAERFLDILVLDGLRIHANQSELFLSEAECLAADRICREHRIAEKDSVLCLAPFAADNRRTWPLERFWEVAVHFARSGVKVLVLGSGKEIEFLRNNPLPDHPFIINLAGKLSILETAAVIKKSSAFLGNDSGLGHIAGAMSTPTLILGYFITRVWHPLSPSVRLIIKDTGCESCNVNTCTRKQQNTLECFSMISTREVISQLTKMMIK